MPITYLNLYQHAKNQLIPYVHSKDIVNFSTQKPDWLNPFFDHAQPKDFRTNFNFCEFVSMCKKNETVLSISSGEKDDLKILQSNWLCLRNKISQEYKICAGTQQIISIFIVEQIQGKLITKFLFKFKKLFLAHFHNFWNKKKVFPKIHAITHNFFIRVSSSMPKFRET